MRRARRRSVTFLACAALALAATFAVAPASALWNAILGPNP